VGGIANFGEFGGEKQVGLCSIWSVANWWSHCARGIGPGVTQMTESGQTPAFPTWSFILESWDCGFFGFYAEASHLKAPGGIYVHSHPIYRVYKQPTKRRAPSTCPNERTPQYMEDGVDPCWKIAPHHSSEDDSQTILDSPKEIESFRRRGS